MASYSQPLPPRFTFPVVGVTFVDGYPDNLLRLRAEIDEMESSQGDEHLTVVLIRNPVNEHDPNAIEVHMPAMSKVGMLGHVPANMAARLAPELDAGKHWVGELVDVVIHRDHMDRPGLRVQMWRVTDGS